MLHVVYIFLDTHEQHDLVLHNTNKDYLYVSIVSFVSWKAWILFYQFAWGHLLAKLLKARLTLQVKNSFVLLVVQNSFVLSMWVHGTFLINIQRTYCHTEYLTQWLELMLKGSCKVNSKSFTWSRNPNYLMTITSPHEIS